MTKERNGSKSKKRTVHIEHTVPVGDLARAARYNIHKVASPADLHRFLLDHSICTALSHEEETLIAPYQQIA